MMTRHKLITARVLLPLLTSLVLCAGLIAAQPVAFMVVDDVHYASEKDYDWATIEGTDTAEAKRVRRNVDRSQKTFVPLMQELKLQAEKSPARPFAIFSCGDLIHGGPGVRADVHCGNFIRLFESLKMPIPLFNANGNHEMAEQGMEAAYDQHFLPFLSQQLGHPLKTRHYSVTRGNSHFILLDGLPPDREGGDHEDRLWALNDRQWAWLESELETNKDRDHIFVFTHATLWPLGDGDVLYGNDIERHRRLVDLLLKYNVRAVFAGHKHLNSVTVYQHDGRQLVQMIPNSDLPDPARTPSPTRVIAYTPENIVPRMQRNWDQWGRAIVAQYQAEMVHHETTPGAAGYFLVHADGPEVTVRTYIAGSQLLREYTLTRDAATGATRFHVK